MIDSMECGCSKSCDLDDLPDAWSVSYPCARKEHRCCECKEVIPIGIEYERVWGIWCGDMETFKTCNICASIRGDLGCCAPYGDLRESIWEYLGVDYTTGKINEHDEKQERN